MLIVQDFFQRTHTIYTAFESISSSLHNFLLVSLFHLLSDLFCHKQRSNDVHTLYYIVKTEKCVDINIAATIIHTCFDQVCCQPHTPTLTSTCCNMDPLPKFLVIPSSCSIFLPSIQNYSHYRCFYSEIKKDSLQRVLTIFTLSQ